MWVAEAGDNQIARVSLGGYQLRDLAGDTTTFTAAGAAGNYCRR